jgi:hypothetical protein
MGSIGYSDLQHLFYSDAFLNTGPAYDELISQTAHFADLDQSIPSASTLSGNYPSDASASDMYGYALAFNFYDEDQDNAVPTWWVTSYMRPLAHAGLWSLASAAALNVGDLIEPGSTWPLQPTLQPCSTTADSVLGCSTHKVMAAVAFTAATTAIHHLNRHHRYQDCCLFTGITAGIVAGLAKSWSSERCNVYEAGAKLLTWSILAGLLCSMIIHRLQSRKFAYHNRTVSTERHGHGDLKKICQDCGGGEQH